MSDWQWFNDFDREARQRDDPMPGRLLQIHEQGFQLRETCPEQALALFAEGQRLARSYGHLWWVMLFEHWQVHGTIYYKRDYRNILDGAVQNLLNVRKPAYAGYPQRIWVASDLITIYQCVDPLGYEDEIRAAIAYLESEVGEELSAARYLLQINKVTFALDHESLDEALNLTSIAQGWLESDPDRHTAGHFRVDFTAYPAVIAFKKRDWTELAAAATVAEEAARQRNVHNSLANALMWQAVAARHSGDSKRAGRLFRAAQTQRRKLGRPPGSWFYLVWATYQELGDSLPRVLQIRNQEYNDVRNRGMLAYECWILTEICRLKTALRTYQPEDREAAYQAALRLRKPQGYLAALERAVPGKSETA
jgi:hypothetical protein